MTELSFGKRQQPRRPGRRVRPGVTALVAGALLMAGCGTGSTSAAARSKTEAVWVSGNPTVKAIMTTAAKRYNALNTGLRLTVYEYPGPAYTTKFDAARAAGHLPLLYTITTHADLQSLATTGQLANLSALLPAAYLQKFLPTVLQTEKVNGKVYGLPFKLVQPFFIFYNKKDFRRAGIVRPPKSWPQFLGDVRQLRSHGITPLALSGATGGYETVWLHYLELRLGGLGATNLIAANNKSVWDSASMVRAATLAQQLVAANAFQHGYSTTTDASEVANTLLATGKAAMELSGAFLPDFVRTLDPSFIKSGNMGYFPFPTVPGGTGSGMTDPGTFASLAINRRYPSALVKKAANFVVRDVATSSYVNAFLKAGDVLPVRGEQALIAKLPSKSRSFPLFVYGLLRNSRALSESWSSLMPTHELYPYDKAIAGLFLKTVTPKGFGRTMSNNP